MRLLIFLKFILVLALICAGVFFLLKGFGVSTPFVSYRGAEAHDVPAGIVLVVLGILLARFWRIRTSRETIMETKVQTVKAVRFGRRRPRHEVTSASCPQQRSRRNSAA
jgi:hypothetical protein